MQKQVYQEKNFIVIRTKSSYVVINRNKDFEVGHTHLRSLSACKKVIHCARLRIVNGDMNRYMLTSVIRISEDGDYIRKIEDLIEIKSHKGRKRKYYNRG